VGGHKFNRKGESMVAQTEGTQKKPGRGKKTKPRGGEEREGGERKKEANEVLRECGQKCRRTVKIRGSCINGPKRGKKSGGKIP